MTITQTHFRLDHLSDSTLQLRDPEMPPRFDHNGSAAATGQYPTYQTPQSGILSWLPESWIPYAELMRLEKPVGWILVYFQHIFGELLAATITTSPISTSRLIYTNFILLFWSFQVRSLGCCWNDYIDQEVDRKVTRTRLRPLARRAISSQNALIFTACQLVLVMTGLLCLLPDCSFLAVPPILLTAAYPFAKRYTSYPQAILGLAVAWGVPFSFAALGVDFPSSTRNLTAISSLSFAGICWTTIYDTIYAAQDMRDDEKAGVLSTAIRFQSSMKTFLSLLSFAMICFILMTGMAIHAGLAYLAFAVAGTAFVLMAMIQTLDLEDRMSCKYWFSNGAYYVGAAMVLGLGGEYMRVQG